MFEIYLGIIFNIHLQEASLSVDTGGIRLPHGKYWDQKNNLFSPVFSRFIEMKRVNIQFVTQCNCPT